MRILVTGATGKIGSRIVPHLLERGDRVRAFVRRAAHGDSLRARGATVAVGDQRQPETLGAAVDGIDAVLHLAAFFRGATPEEARATNVAGTRLLAEAALAAGVPRFLFISTNLVYGPGHGRPAREGDPLRPTGEYPASKVAAEQVLDELRRTDGLGLRILRLAFVYGAGDPHLTEFAPFLRAWSPTRRLHLVHHDDVAQAALLALDAPGIDGRIYNVGDDEPVSAGEILRLVGAGDQADIAGRSVEDPWEGIVDTTRIREDLDFRPRYRSLLAARAAGTL